MTPDKPRTLVRLEYARAAEAYLRGLRLEHFMEATAQATQREITVESLALVHARRSEVQYFNELLVQYPHGRTRQIRQVVPDNMVVVHDQPIQAEGSYDLPLQPVGPFWVLEYVSKHTHRKDNEDSYRKYERELKVPYYLLFYPEGPELTLFRLGAKKYASVTADATGRHPLPELDMAVALHQGWVRYWFQGQLLPLPADLQSQVEQLQTRLQQAERQVERERQEKERLLAQLRKLGISPTSE
jgi:Uma2 family endonuclease